MIWIVFIFIACKNDATKIGESSVKDGMKRGEQATHSVQSQPKMKASSSNAPKDSKQTAGEIHTKIGKKDVDIKYQQIESLKGTTDGKKITGLDIKIGNMNITVDEVEVEGLKIEKKETSK